MNRQRCRDRALDSSLVPTMLVCKAMAEHALTSVWGPRKHAGERLVARLHTSLWASWWKALARMSVILTLVDSSVRWSSCSIMLRVDGRP